MMKNIIKTSKQHQYEQSLKEEKMTDDCTCPECGCCELMNGLLESRRYEGGFFFGKYVTYDIYKCVECGCEWEIKQ